MARAASTAKRRNAGPKDAGPGVLTASAAGDVRVGPVFALPTLLTEFGIAPQSAFARAGVKAATFSNPENRISLRDLGRLFAESATLTRCDHLGLLAGQRSLLKNIGAVGYLMANCPTVGEALRALALQFHLEDRGGVPVVLDVDSISVLLGYRVYTRDTPGLAHILDAAIAIGHRILEGLCGPAWKPLHVQFSHASPADTGPYRSLFGAKVWFNREISGIVFARSWLEHAVPGADPALHDLIAGAIQRAREGGGMTFAEEVQRVLHQMLPSGGASAKEVARLFGIHERTLRKRLTAAATSLQQLVSRTRFEMAQQLLKDTQLPLSQIATALHYSDPAVFSRAFRSWAKTSPSRWRARTRD
jgi:AraC-like DNA-binding protein